MHSQNTSIVRLALLLVAAGLLLTGCGGGSSGSALLPAAALSVEVAPGGSNPGNVINGTTDDAVSVSVVLPPASKASDVVTVVLTDGFGTEASAQGQGNGIDGGGPVVISVDASGLADGSIDVLVQSQTDGGAAESRFDDAFMKDTLPPELPTAVTPLDAQGAAFGYVNIATTPAATMRATFQVAGNGQDTARLHVRDGSQEVSTPAQTYASSVVTFPAVDLNALADGAIDLEVVVTDASMNSASFTAQATKDTVAPQSAVAAQVPASASNPVDMINIVTTPAAMAEVACGADTEARTVLVSMTDTVVTVMSTPVSMPLAGGTVPVGAVDVSTLADGPITLVAVVSDLAGNQVQFPGTAATKDTVAPAGPSSAAVAAGASNPASVVNLVSAQAVDVGLAWPPAASGADTATVSLTAGAASVTSTPFSVPGGGGPGSVGGLDCSALTDGALAVSVTVTDPAGNTTTVAGSPAQKDTIPPQAPSIARVAGGPQNGQDVINVASVGSAGGALTFPATAQGDETFVMSLNDGATTVAFAATPVPAGGGPAAVAGLDCSGLSDGFVSVMVTVTDPAQNTTQMTGTTAMKDTVGPTVPIAASVDSGAGNASDVINLSNVGAVSVSVTWPASAPGSETAGITLTGGGTVAVPVPQTAGGGVVSVSNIDASGLADGAVSVSVTTTDGAGNTATFNGTNAAKDTVLPIAATAVAIPAGPSNPAGWVNAATATAATVQVAMPPASTGAETVSLTCTDGVSSVVLAAQAVPAGGGMVTFPVINMAGLADGGLTLTASVSDVAGNTVDTNAAAGAKDTVAPAAPTDARVPAGASNPADMINSATVLAASVDVSWPGDAGNEQMSVVLSDGISSQASPPQMLAAGPATVGFSGLDCTALADGTLSVSVQIADEAGNTTSYSGVPATKDTVDPVPPTAAHVMPSANNPIDVINGASAPSVVCDVTFAGGASATDVATVTVSDGLTGASSGAQAVTPGATVTYSGIDASAANDGPITLTVNVIDLAGNVVSWAGTAATKDTAAPMAATAAVIPAGGGNPQNVITLATQAAVAVDATVPAQGSGMMVSCDLSIGGATVSGTPQPAPAGGGAVNFTGVDCTSLFEGTVTVTVTVTDAAGNQAAFASAASKDVTPPALLVDPTTTPTSAAQQTVTGETEAGSAVSIGGGMAAANGVAGADGRFAIPVALTLSSANSLTVTATDAVGNAAVGSTDFAGGPLAVTQSASAPPVLFTDVSVASGLAVSGAVAGGSFQDLDGDGDLDLFVGGSNKMWQNAGGGAFADVTASAGISAMPAVSAVFGDYDNDGDLDLLLVDAAAASLFRNDTVPGESLKFTDVTAVSGIGVAGMLTAGLCSDLDQDGFVDFVVVDRLAGPVVRRNLGDGTFAAAAPFGGPIGQMSFGVAADVVADGASDLLFGDAAPGFFWKNDGGMSFSDIAGAASNVSIGQDVPGGTIAADYDNDGDLDLIVAAGGALAASASCGGCPLANNQLFHNDGSTVFTNQVAGQPLALLAGIEPSDGWLDLCAGDVDNDGRLDIFVGRVGLNRLFLNVGDATGADRVWEFLEVAGASAVAGADRTHMVQLADVDGDGDLDVLAGNHLGVNELYRNEINNRRNLTVHVRGLGAGITTASRDAIGAHVDLLDAAGTTLLASREISGGRGHGSQDPLRAHFGVTPSQIYTVRVTFPSGAVRTMSDVVPRDAANQTITVSE